MAAPATAPAAARGPNPDTPMKSTRKHLEDLRRWDEAPKAKPGLLMREQMGWPMKSNPKPITP